MGVRTVIPAIAVAAALLGYALYWHLLSERVRDGIAGWADERRNAGWSVEFSDPDLAGFPFRISIRIRAARMAAPGGSPEWRLPDATLTMAPWSPGRIRIDAPGTHRIAFGGNEAVVEAAEAEIVLGAQRAATLAAPSIRLSGGAALEVRTVKARIEKPPGNPAGFTLSARSLSSPRLLPPGRAVSDIRLEGMVQGSAEPADALGVWAERWRDAGGEIALRSFALSWGTLEIRGDGAFLLDGDLQPEGALNVEVADMDRAAEALAAAGIAPSIAMLAVRLVRRPDGSVRVPVRLQRRRLYLGPVPVLELRPVRWNF